MVSKSNAKFIKSLQLKKYRKQEQCFLVEGAKSVLEVVQSDFIVQQVIATENFTSQHEATLKNIETLLTTEKQLTALGTLKNNDTALAVVRMKDDIPLTLQSDDWYIALDDVNDPGNLGTILRIADWYDIPRVICSEQTADVYNPKVIAASKGSFCRTQVWYASLDEVLRETEMKIYGAVMEGESVHTTTFDKGGILVMGNEANGISDTILQRVTDRITIPRYGQAESLNVAMATAIICDNIKRGR